MQNDKNNADCTVYCNYVTIQFKCKNTAQNFTSLCLKHEKD